MLAPKMTAEVAIFESFANARSAKQEKLPPKSIVSPSAGQNPEKGIGQGNSARRKKKQLDKHKREVDGQRPQALADDCPAPAPHCHLKRILAGAAGCGRSGKENHCQSRR
jgi:hypothetical protein